MSTSRRDPIEIATARFELIAPLIDSSLSAAQRRVALREALRTSREEAQDEKRRLPSRSTLYRWVAVFRKKGFVGLLPKQRADRGRTRSAGTDKWVTYAIALLYEQPDRSLTQLDVYLRAEFEDFSLRRSTLARHLRAHPAYGGIAKLRGKKPKKLRDLYEAQAPHESWQLDGKGRFLVRFVDGSRAWVRVLAIIDDYSREVLAAVVAVEEDTNATIVVFEKAVAKWGLARRFQFDRGSAFDSKTFRAGLAQLGIHRNWIRPRNPEADGKIEAFNRILDWWFVRELRAQEVVDFDHLQQLLEAMLALVYSQHHHRSIGTTPEKRLAGRVSDRRVSQRDVEHAFFVKVQAKSDAKTGEVRLPSGSFRVPTAFAGQRSWFRYHPVHAGRAVLVAHDGREIELPLFTKKPLSELKPRVAPRGTGQLQKLVDRWQGKERPNAQPGFGLPEVYRELGVLVGRALPQSEQDALDVRSFYRRHGPLPREAFVAACARARKALGEGRPLSAYLTDLERQIAGQGS
jgi:putative transposase